MRYVVTYDITDDTTRTKVAATLQSIGDRVQYSVFLCDVAEELLVNAIERCQKLINPVTDSVYVFNQCQNCWGGLQTHGQAHPHEPVYYWAVW